MQARTLPARHGALWLAGGFTLFRRNPPMLTALTFAYLLVVVLLNVLPGIGPLLLALALPTLTAVLGNGCHAIERRHAVGLAELTRGLESHRRSLMRLGLLNLAGSAVTIGVGIALDLDITVDPSMNEARAGELLRNMAMLMLLATPLLMAFWFAPLLVVWNGVTPAKAVFFSLVASWRNWRAFAMYGLAVLVIGMLLPALLLVLVGSVVGAAAPALAFVLRMALVFVLAPVLVASVYLSYRDVFHAPPHAIDLVG